MAATIPLSIEKLCPVLSFYVVADWREGCERCKQILRYGGMGHTMSIHSRNDEVILQFGLKKPAFRIVVNSPTTHGSIGLSTGLEPAMTLGCGGYGGNITSDNISPRHLLNIKRLAYEVDAGARALGDRRRADRSAAAQGAGRAPRCRRGSPPARWPSESTSSSRRAAMSAPGASPAAPVKGENAPPPQAGRARARRSRCRAASRSRSHLISCARTMCGRRCGRVASSSSANRRSSRRPPGTSASSTTSSSRPNGRGEFARVSRFLLSRLGLGLTSHG